MAFNRFTLRAVAALGLIGAVGVSQAQLVPGRSIGSRQRGEHVFERCRPCHSLDAGRNLTGPTLHGVLGRRAGTVPGYIYSPAMRRATIVWGADTLSRFLAAPGKQIPGNKMSRVPGIQNPTALGDLLAYLEAASR